MTFSPARSRRVSIVLLAGLSTLAVAARCERDTASSSPPTAVATSTVTATSTATGTETQVDSDVADVPAPEAGASRFIEGLRNPEGINVDRAGNLYVAEFGRHQILRFDPSLKLTGWLGASDQPPGWRTGKPRGKAGSALNELSKPHSIDFDGEGNLYVTEYGNNRIQKFSPDGAAIGFLGVDEGGKLSEGFKATPTIRTGSANGLMVGLATAFFLGSRRDLYVTDYGSSTVIRFSSEGRYLDHVGGFNKPHMAAVADDGTIYIADTWNHRLVRFAADWTPKGWLGAAADFSTTQGWRVDGQAVASPEPGGLAAPVSVLLDAAGDLIVAEHDNARISKFGRDGSFKGWIGGTSDGAPAGRWRTQGHAVPGTGPGYFSLPYDVRIFGDRLYVCEKGNGRVQIMALPP